MNRSDFQRLARIRIKEAKALLDRELYDGAYYLAGYSVECALKACIAKKTKKYEFPDKNLAQKTHTHDLSSLIEAAGLMTELKKQMALDDRFALNWAVIKSWTEQSRYQVGMASKARNLYDAIAKRDHGVMRWLRGFW